MGFLCECFGGKRLQKNAGAPVQEIVILERMVRRITLFGTLPLKIELLNSFRQEILGTVSENLRAALFGELLNTVNMD